MSNFHNNNRNKHETSFFLFQNEVTNFVMKSLSGSLRNRQVPSAWQVATPVRMLCRSVGGMGRSVAS